MIRIFSLFHFDCKLTVHCTQFSVIKTGHFSDLKLFEFFKFGPN